MVKDLSLQKLHNLNVLRCKELWHGIDEWSPEEWLMCLTGEVGELASKLKHRRRGEAVPQREVGEELADILIYLDLLAASLRLDLAAETIRKFNLTSYQFDSIYKLEGEEEKPSDS